MISINGGLGAEQSFVHFCPEANLFCSYRICRYRLIDVGQPSEAGRSPARTSLGDAFRFQGTRRLQDDLVDLTNRGNRIVRRLVVMLWVVASGHGIGKVKLVAVEVPIADKALRELMIILLDFGHCRTERTQIGRRASRLSVLIKNQPVRMISHHVRQLVRTMIKDIFAASIFDNDRNPPQRQVNSRIVISLDYLLQRVIWKGVLSWQPISTRSEPPR